MKIAVLGGGLSGIMLARLLQEKGHECHIFESEDHVGGLCSTRTGKGFVYDLAGGHVLHSRNTEILSYILSATGEDNWNNIIRNTKIFYEGNYVKYPFENGLADLPKEDNYECLMGYIHAHYERKNMQKTVPRNFHDWIYYRFGKGIANKFMIPYNQKIWNYNLKHIGVDWIEGRVPSAPVEDVVKASIGILTEGYAHQVSFYYPKKGGFQFLTNKLAEPLQNVHLSTPVYSLEHPNGKFILNNSLEFDEVINTLPIQELLGIIKNIPPFVAATIESLWYNGVLTVFVGLDKPFEHNYSWIYLPHKENGPPNRLTFLSNYSENNTPAGCGSILVEVTYKAKSIPEKRDQIVDCVINHLDQCKILNKENVIYTDTAFYKYAYPVYSLKFPELSQIISNYLNEIKLKRFGRFATYAYYNVDHIIEKAFEFVNTWY